MVRLCLETARGELSAFSSDYVTLVSQDRIDVGLPISTYDDMRSPFPLTPDEDMAGLPTGSDADVKVKLRKKWHQV